MKKSLLLFVVMLILLICSSVNKVDAAISYQSFQEITMSKGKLLKDYTDKELSSYYSEVDKRKFVGWKTKFILKDVKAKYISKTIFSYYNQGSSSITYSYNLSETETEKFSVSSSGSISTSGTSSAKGFKNGLNSILKLEGEYSKSTTTVKKKDLDIVVDPGTVANLRIVGEGKVTNGVAANYFLFIRTNRGGFEYFVVTTEYPRLEVLPI